MSQHQSFSPSSMPPATHLETSTGAKHPRQANRARNNIIVVEFCHDQFAQAGSSDSEAGGCKASRSNKRQRSQAGNKPSGACVHCKSLKVRCQFSRGEARCDRCIAGNHECVTRTRKQRKAAPTHDDLRIRARQQDSQIQSLLAKFDDLHTDAKVNKWVQQSRQLGKLGYDEKIARPAVPATRHYYSSLIGPLDVDLSLSRPNHSKIPMILRSGIIDAREVVDLFNLYFERIDPFFTILDGKLHCPQKLIWRSPLLFTVICACAARHYNRQGLWALTIDIAWDAAAEALITGPVSVETVQSLLILAVYPVPKKKWIQDKSWLFMGAAIRMAQEIGLDRPQTSADIRENLNRTRTWINAVCVDGSHATLFGKMPMIKFDDYLVRRNVRTWYMSHNNTPYDIALCAYAELLLDMLKFRNTIGPIDSLADKFREGFDVVSHCTQFDKDLTQLVDFWSARLDADPNVAIYPAVRYRCHTFRMVASSLRIVILSVAFRYSFKQGMSREDYILQQSIKVARLNIQTVLNALYPSGLLSWALEASFLYMAFCAAFLLNLLRPKLLPLLDAAQCLDIVTLVQRLIEILGSDAVALDGRHSPALYSKFLSNLLEKYYTPALREQIDGAESPPHPSSDEGQHFSATFSWPDVPSYEPTPSAEPDDHSGGQGSHVVREEEGDAEMDFSLSHFVQSAIPPANTTQQDYHSQPNAATTASADMYAPYSAEAIQQFQYPFNYAAMLDIAHMQTL